MKRQLETDTMKNIKNFKEYVLENLNKDSSSKRQTIDYLLNMNRFDSFEDFKETITTMVDIEEYQSFYNDQILDLISSVFVNNNFEKKRLVAFINELIATHIPLGDKYNFYYALYQKFKRDPSYQFPVNEGELKIICLERLKKFVEDKTRDLDKCSFLYYLCRERVDEQNHVILQTQAHPIMKAYIDIYPWSYIESLIRPYMTPIYKNSWPDFTIEPFVQATFKGWDNFWTFLEDFKSHSDYYQNRLLFERYYLFFREFENNGYKPLIVEKGNWPKFGIDYLIEAKKWKVV